MIRFISLIAYYADLIINVNLAVDYSHETYLNQTSGEELPYHHSISLSWLLLGFLAFGRIVSFAFFLFNFGLKNVPNVSRCGEGYWHV